LNTELIFLSGLKNLKVKICSLKTDTYAEKTKHIFVSCEKNAGQYRNIMLGIISSESVEEIKYLRTTLSNQT